MNTNIFTGQKSRFLTVILAMLLLVGLLAGQAGADGGAYTFDFSAADPDLYIPPIPFPGGPTCPTGSGSDPIANAYHTLPAGGAGNVESLAPDDMALGQIVPFEILVKVSGNTQPEDGKITFTAGWNTETTSGSDFGYDETYGVVCAFIDTGDGAHNDPGADAAVTAFSSSWVDASGPPAPDEIQGVINLEGLDDGDEVVVEVWLVLDETIPTGSTGNVQSRLVSAETIAATPETINTGNQTVPLLRVQEFFSAEADLSISKSDNPDPVDLEGRLTYSIVAINNGSAIANNVQVVDTLDPNTTFVSAVADNGGNCSEAGGIVTCDLGAIVPGTENQVTITIVVDVSATAPTAGGGGDGPCDGSEDLCNYVSISSITDDPDTSNNSDSEPTDVNEPPGQIIVDKVTIPANDPISFNFTLDGPGTGRIINFSLTDQDAPYVSPNLTKGTYVLTEAPNAAYSTSGSCDDGSDPSAIDLQPGEIVTCTFTNTLQEDPPSIVVTKTASPTSVNEPGGSVNFTVTIENTSDPTDPVTISSLTDNIHGDLNGQGDCSVPQTIQPGDTYSCTFSAIVSGDPGESETDTVTAIGTDDEGTAVSHSDDATVTIADVPSSIEVVKTAAPDNVDEPGGNVTFSFVVNNLSTVDTVTIDTLNDTIYGDLNGQGDCAVPQTLAPGNSYSCSFVAFVGSTETNVVTASGVDDDGKPVSDTDDATVTVNDSFTNIVVTKTADPTSVNEPGGDVTFSVVIDNPSALDEVTINSLTDSIYGDLNGQGDCSVPQTIPIGGSYSCSFIGAVTGNAGDVEEDVVTASGVDEDGYPVSGSDNALVTINDVPSAIEIIKTATPDNVDEPGGSVTFSFVINNLSPADAVTINTLDDTIYGDLNGQGGCSVPQTIPVGGSYSCSITVQVAGNAGDTITNVATASGVDDDGSPVSDDDDAVVTINDVPASIELLKTAAPLTIAEPGGLVTYDFVINNLSTVDTVTIETLIDSIYGDLHGQGNCSVPQIIPPGGSYNCSITEYVSGNPGDTIVNLATASGTDDDGYPVSDEDNATVTITDVPSSILTTKTADPGSVPETGGDVTFTIVVENTSEVDNVTIESVVDSVFGDVSASCAPALPATLAPGASLTCAFTEFLSGDAGQIHSNVATASGQDDDGNPVEDDDSEDVTFDDVLPDITVTKTAVPTTVSEPGGDVAFTFVVTNNNSESITLDILDDDIYGDLNGQGDCLLPQTLAGGGGSYSCTITEFVSGDAGDSHTNTVTATASDNDGNNDSDTDDATVTVDDATPAITVVKTASPTSVDEPGANVTFTVEVTNDSVSSDPVTIDSLTDSIHGDLDGKGNCSVPQTIQPGDTYTCAFTAFVAGNASDSETDVVTASGTDDEGNPIEDNDNATVTITDVPSSILTTKTADPTSVPETGGDVTFTVVVENTSAVDDVTIEAVVDNVFGDVSAGCVPALPATLAPGESVTCAFTEFLSGNAGEIHTNVSTASGTDDDGNPVEDDDSEDVTFDDVLPEIMVEKTADPTSVPETGGIVEFTFLVTNIGTEDATLDSLIDTHFGDLNGQGDCSVPQNLAGDSGTYSCAVSVFLSGDASGPDHYNVVTAVASDDDGNTTEDTDDETVFFDDVLPDISITKTADPTSVPETGGNVTFTFLVTNHNTEDVTLDSLIDTEFGDLNGQGDCVVPQSLAGNGGTYSCSIVVFLSGDHSGRSHHNVVTAVASDDDGNSDEASDEETVTFDDVLPDITVTKTAVPTSVSEPGGDVAFTFLVVNNGLETVTLDSLVDDTYGDLNGQGDCSLPQTLAGSGGSYNCTITKFVSGNAGSSHINVVTATASDNDGNNDSDTDEATVTVDDALPAIAVVKTAVPTNVPEPGADVTFTVDVTNNSSSTDPVTINSLTDDIHGDLNGQGDCSVPQTIQPGDTYTCTFTALVEGDAGDTETDTVTAAGVDDEDNPVSDFDDATVTVDDVLPAISVDKTANPTNVPEPGADVTFAVVVNNDSISTDPVTITSLIDSIHGDLNGQGDCAVPQTIQPGAGYSCTFTAFVAGNAGDTETDVVTASGTDDEGNEISGDDDATVTVDNVDPIIEVVKTAVPTNVPEPGADVTFTVDVTNNSVSSDPVTIDTLTDDIHGNLHGQGDCSVPQTIQPGDTYTCAFTAFVAGNSGDTETDTVTASGSDDDGIPVSDSDEATVTVDDVNPAITVVKTADPTSVDEPGANVTFTVEVTNDSVSTDPVTIDSLIDSIHGDLNGRGDCAVPQTIQPGDTYTCAFTALVKGNAADSETDVVTASGTDDEGNPVSDEDNATVTITDVPSSILTTKTADPSSVPETGGDVTFTIVVENTSAVDDVTIEAVVDDVFGDVSAGCVPALPATLAPGESVTCAFTEFLSGDAGQIHTNVSTASGTDDDGNPVEDDDSEDVTFDDVLPDITVLKTADPTSVLETGGNVTFTFLVTNHNTEDVTLDSLNDLVFGDLNGQGDCVMPQSLAGNGGTYSCSIEVFLSGDHSGRSHHNVVTAVASDDDGNSDEATDDETVTFDDVLPDITVTKTADPTSVSEPGGDVAFTFLVENNGLETVTLDSLVDDTYGDLHGQGNCSLPKTLAGSGGSYSCTITKLVSGNAGSSHINVVTATASDNDGNIDIDTDDATVTVDNVLPAIAVVKTTVPTNVPEPGDDVTFTVEVTNNSVSTDPVTIDSLLDDVHGDLNGQGDCAVGQTIQPGDTYTCTFTAFVGGNSGDTETDIVTASGSDDEGTPVSASDDATVTVDDVLPAISVVKTADPTNVPEPGGNVTFSVAVTNDSVSTDPVTIDSLIDSIHGDLNGRGDCTVPQTIQPGDTYTCAFTALVKGNAGDTETDVVTASGTDDEGNPVSDDDNATVTVDNVDPVIKVTKTAGQLQVFAPGEDVTFTVVVENNSVATDPVTINSLTDSIHGDLNGQGDCSVPQTIQPGAAYNCSFTVLVDGDETDVVTASGTDDDGTPVSDSDDATVDMINPSIVVEKSTNGFDADSAPGPEILAGSAVNWTYVVTNDGDVTLKNIYVVDDQGVVVSCPQNTLAVGVSITCTASGIAGTGQYANVGTAYGGHTDVDGDTTTRNDSDPSHYYGAAPSIAIVKTFVEDSVTAGGAGSSFTLVVTNDGNVDLENVAVFDNVDARLSVTGVSGTAGADNDSDGDPQTVEWLIADLAVGASATITVNFEVGSSVPAAAIVNNSATASSDYVDDSGNSQTVSDTDADTIEILTDINLSIVKTFNPTAVPQGTAQSFTIEVSNAGPSDAVDVSVVDTVNSSLVVTGVSMTSGSGDCTASAGQGVDCTVQIPAGQSVLITAEYMTAPFEDDTPDYGTVSGDEFRFVFVNGSILEGSTDGGPVYLDGVDITADVTIITGLTKNDIIFDPPGSDPAFELHLSCSDPFTGGWGQSGGPVEGVDTNWQIAFFSIARYQNGDFRKNCGNVVNPFAVPNTATASGTHSTGTETVSDSATVTVEPGITLTGLQTGGKRLTVRLSNFTGVAKDIADVSIEWPSKNGNLIKIRLDEPIVWKGSAAPTSALLDSSDSGWFGGTLQEGEAILRFDFTGKSGKSGYTIRINFTDGTFLDISA